MLPSAEGPRPDQFAGPVSSFIQMSLTLVMIDRINCGPHPEGSGQLEGPFYEIRIFQISHEHMIDETQILHFPRAELSYT